VVYLLLLECGTREGVENGFVDWHGQVEKWFATLYGFDGIGCGNVDGMQNEGLMGK
jgi:hypothetical protein